MNSCKSNYSHCADPQTVDFYTADLHFDLLSDHNDNFSKYNKKKNIYRENINLLLNIKGSQDLLKSLTLEFVFSVVFTQPLKYMYKNICIKLSWQVC